MDFYDLNSVSADMLTNLTISESNEEKESQLKSKKSEGLRLESNNSRNMAAGVHGSPVNPKVWKRVNRRESVAFFNNLAKGKHFHLFLNYSNFLKRDLHCTLCE